MGKKKTNDEFKKEVYNCVGSDYTFLDEYKTTNTPMWVQHTVDGCGYKYQVRPRNFLNLHQRCPVCNGGVRYTTEKFKEQVAELVGDEYEVLGDYKNNRTKVDLLHKVCGKIYPADPSHFIHSGRRCTHCNGGIKYTKDRVLTMLKENTGDDYDIIGDYNGMLNKSRLKHLKCGFEWETAVASYVHNNCYCPKCNSSKGERALAEYLTAHNISYVTQHSFDDCRHKYKLSFDFAIFTNDTYTDLLYLIEYDGIQHFEPTAFFGGEKGFKYRLRNDKIKNDYCNEHGINLIRVPYTELASLDTYLDQAIEDLEGLTLKVS